MSQHSPSLVIVGSLNLDLVIQCQTLPRPGETVLAKSHAELPGGKGANQAVAAARLMSEVGNVRMIGRVGADAYGEQLLHSLAADNVDTSYVKQTAGTASGLAVVAVEESGENSILVLPGANAKLSPQDIADAKAVIAASDILLVQLETPWKTVATAIQLARQSGVRTILNPAPVQQPLPAELLEVDIICPNLSEAASLVGRELNSKEDAMTAAAELRAQSTNEQMTVIITLGGDGVVFADAEQTDWLPAFAVDAVDTTAAGDAFAGALAVRLAEGAALREALTFAAAAGGLATTCGGAQPALPTRDAVEKLLARNA